MAKGTAAPANGSKPSKLAPNPHPPYFQMVCEAIAGLKDRTGSSSQAIAKFLEEKYGKLLPPNFRKSLSIQLKNCVKSEKLVKVKNSFKISASQKTKLGNVQKSRAAAAPAKGKKPTKSAASAPTPKQKAAKKVAAKAKAEKTKRLSQVKTPEAMKKAAAAKKKAAAPAVKRAKPAKKETKTKTKPVASKKPSATPVKRKAPSKSKSSAPAAKKAKK